MFAQEPFRIEPAAPPGAYQTYQVLAPLQTHFVAATCQEVDCPQFREGWRLRAEGLSERDVYVATHCGRKFTRVNVAEGETWLVYEAGQPCFRASGHRRRLEREEHFIIRGGDYRGNPTGMRAKVSVDSWVDDFGEHQDRLAERVERG
jgi:hypothetical protein